MASTTGEHIDELETRRKRRERRQPTPGSDAKPQSGAAARELWRDLLAGAPDGKDGAEGPEAANGAEPGPVDDAAPANAPPDEVHVPKTAGIDAEGIDELVRRVQAGTEAAAAEAAVASGQRRPAGTADLSADAVRRDRPARRRAPLRATWAQGQRPVWRGRRMVAIAVGLVAGVALLVALGESGGHRAVATHRVAVSSTALGAASLAALTAIPNTIGAMVHRLEAEKAGQSAPRKHARRATKHPRARARRYVATPTQTALAQQSAPVSEASPSSASSQTPAYTSPPAATNQSSSTGASSSSRSSQPAGPTNAGPLGGIGSCVKGC